MDVVVAGAKMPHWPPLEEKEAARRRKAETASG
jgi:hypothetical protein